MSRTGMLLLVLAGVASVGVRESAGCSCAPISPCSLCASADVVFLLKVIGVEESVREKRVHMRVVRVWKGQISGDVTVSTEPGSSASCSIDAEVGQRRVVYAELSTGRLSTSFCSGRWALRPGESDPELPPPGGIRCWSSSRT